MKRWLTGLGILLVLLTLMSSSTVYGQAADESPPDVPAEDGAESGLFETLVFLAGLTAAVVEVVKPAIKSLPVGSAGHDFLLRLVGFGLGVGFVLGGGAELNLLTLSPVYGALNPLIGQILTGLMVGGGGQLIFLVGSGLARKPVKPPEVTRYIRE